MIQFSTSNHSRRINLLSWQVTAITRPFLPHACYNLESHLWICRLKHVDLLQVVSMIDRRAGTCCKNRIFLLQGDLAPPSGKYEHEPTSNSKFKPDSDIDKLCILHLREMFLTV